MQFPTTQLFRSFLPLLLSLATFGVIAPKATTAQYPAECPLISLSGPTGILHEGELMNYTLSVDLRGGMYEPKYEWSISAGEIVSGQGTKRIEVLRQGYSLTTSVKVFGLPTGCPSSASETANWTPAPQPAKVGTVRGLEFEQNLERLHSFAEELNQNPNNQGFIFIGHPHSSSRRAMEVRERKVLDKIIERLENRDRSRVTVVRYENGLDFVEFWRVPPGANDPACAECEIKPCPAITIIRPDKPISPGTVAVFSVNSDLKNLKGLKFEWTVNAGTVTEGQGTPDCWDTNVRTSYWANNRRWRNCRRTTGL